MRAFVGYGELGRQVDGLVTETEGPDEAWYFDDVCCREARPRARPFDEYLDERFRDSAFYVCLGYRHLPIKAGIIAALSAEGRPLPTIVHRSAHVAGSASVGVGSVVYPLANIDKEVEVDRGVVVNNSVVVSHNSRVGECSYLSPGVVLSGFVTVGARTFIGAGAVVSDRITIGDDAIIGIGTVVTRDVPAGASVIGSPMRELTRRLRL